MYINIYMYICNFGTIAVKYVFAALCLIGPQISYMYDVCTCILPNQASGQVHLSKVQVHVLRKIVSTSTSTFESI